VWESLPQQLVLMCASRPDMTMLQREMAMPGLLQLRSVLFDFVWEWKAFWWAASEFNSTGLTLGR
jgi:hypothetical protein